MNKARKNIEDVCFIVQARLGSQRVPGKMMRSFAGTTLVDIAIEKILKSKIIPKENFYFSVHEPELIEIGKKHGVNIFERSKTSALSENSLTEIFEWHDKLDYKYVVLISACLPFLTVETIDSFVESYLNCDSGGMLAVMEKRQYYWDSNKKMISYWPKEQKIMNTKTMTKTYEAAHCLYASKMDIVKNGYWMDEQIPPNPELFVMKEKEAMDVDYEWEFEMYENLYKHLKGAE
jgi:CMP-N-acetylneuraminic acid synthetase